MIGLLLFLFGALVFAGLAYNLLANGPLLEWDRAIAAALPAMAMTSPAFIHVLMDAGFYVGKEGIVVLGMLLGLYFIYKRYWRELAMLAIGLAGAATLFYSLTAIFNRARPPNQVWIVVDLPGFPSGHALNSVVFFGLLAYLLVPKIRSNFWKTFVIGATILVVGFIGFSRIFTGGHYLTDVLSGYALGIVWSAAVFTLIELFTQKRRTQHV